MTAALFIRRRALGQITPDARVRTVIWKFRSDPYEWVEIFVDECYETIEQQEARFRGTFRDNAEFLTPLDSGTVAAKDWVREPDAFWSDVRHPGRSHWLQ